MLQLLYATTPINKGLYVEVLPLGSICEFSYPDCDTMGKSVAKAEVSFTFDTSQIS
jgi:hypothetical protein